MNTTKPTVAQGKNRVRVQAKSEPVEAVKPEKAPTGWNKFGTIGYDAYIQWVLNGKPTNTFEMNG